MGKKSTYGWVFPQGRPEGGGGANGAIPRFARDPQLKGAPKFARGGGAKCVIKKNYLERFLYKSWYKRNLLDLNFTVIGPRKCFTRDFTRICPEKFLLNDNFTGVCSEIFFEPLICPGYIFHFSLSPHPPPAKSLGKNKPPELKICPGPLNFSMRPCFFVFFFQFVISTDHPIPWISAVFFTPPPGFSKAFFTPLP